VQQAIIYVIPTRYTYINKYVYSYQRSYNESKKTIYIYIYIYISMAQQPLVDQGLFIAKFYDHTQTHPSQ